MILIAFGGNLPFCGAPPQYTIALARQAVEQFAAVTAMSRLYRSPAFPDVSDPDYINACAALRSPLPPDSLLSRLHGIERAFGRRRNRVNAPRTLDLDLIDFGGLTGRFGSGSNDVVLPHPRATRRAFVLKPLLDIAPDWIDPVSGRRGIDCLDDLPQADCDAVRPLMPDGTS